MDEKQFATRLAQLRTQKGVSARDMSLSLGKNPDYINNIENGKSCPSLAGLFYICEYLGLTPAEFFDTSSGNPANVQAITQDLKHLDDRQLDTIAALVKEMFRK